MDGHWYFLIHQIPPRPLYLRAKVRQRLARVGAVALKNSVYVLPATDDALEDFQWIAEEVTNGGGQAWIVGERILGGADDQSLANAFRAARAAEYAELRTELAALQKRAAGSKAAPPAEIGAELARLRERWEAIRTIDFFDSPAGREVEAMIQRIVAKLDRTITRRARVPRQVKGKTWVTRKGIKIDRIASAWLIRRFIDPDARFRFVDATRWSMTEGELAFDIVGGDYSHEADRCTFETLVVRFGIRNRAVTEIAEIVHDVDVKDGKFGRAEAAGVQLMIQGLVAAHAGDTERLERGLALFDDLAQSFAKGTPSAEKPATGKAPRRKGTK